MGRLSGHVRRMRVGIAVAVITLMLVAPMAALASNENNEDERGEGHTTCPGRETLVRIDQQTCPANPNRPPIVRSRSCCQNPAGRIHCFHFEHCPNKSPS